VSRERELDHDSNLYATYRQEEARLRDEHGGLEVRRVVLEQDLKREYQEFLQAHNRGRADSDGVSGLQAAAAVAVLPGRNRVRRKSIQSNRRNRTTFQVLGAV
jgi:hypothetical protein